MEQKKKTCKRCNQQKRIWARGLCQSCDIIENPQKYKIEKKATKKKEKKETISSLKIELDIVFSKYIRYKHSKDGETVECYTCGVIKPIKEMQNAHFWSRTHLSTRWEEKNCTPGCVSCNIFKKGNYIEYTKRMLKDMGQDEFDKLELQKNTPFKINKTWLKEQIELYTQKLNEIRINN